MNWESLSLQEQIAQTIVVRASGYLFDHQIRYPAWEANNTQLQQWLEELNLGGVILLGGSSVELQKRSQQLQSWAKTPLFIAADIEEGIGQRFPGGTWFPPPMALGAIYQSDRHLALSYARQMGEITAREALAVGLNWLLAPVVDVNNNPDNPVINIRAFGSDPEVVSALTGAFIAGAKSYPVLTTAKHFPGHGDTATDSHLELPSLPHDNNRLATIELPPFQNAIAAGVDSVMSAHLLIPAWDKDRPATLSKEIITNRLRKQLGFSGLVVTDALIMGGIVNYASPEEIAVMAIEAGSDILLMPDNPEVAIASIYDAVRSGHISQQRIEKSLERIWQAKWRLGGKGTGGTGRLGDWETRRYYPAKTGLGDWETRRLEDWIDDLSTLEARKTVNLILQDSLKSFNTPINPSSTNNPCNLIVIDDVLNASYLDLNSPAVAIPHRLGYQRKIVDANTLNLMAIDSRPTLLQVFIRGNPFRGNAGLTLNAQHIYQKLLTEGQIEGIVIYGSPYVLQWFKEIIADRTSWVFIYGQMPQAQAIALKALYNLNLDGLEFKTMQNFGF